MDTKKHEPVEVILTTYTTPSRGQSIGSENGRIRAKAARTEAQLFATRAIAEDKAKRKQQWAEIQKPARAKKLAKARSERALRKDQNRKNWKAKHDGQLNATKALLFKALRLMSRKGVELPKDLAAVLSQHESGRARGTGGRASRVEN